MQHTKEPEQRRMCVEWEINIEPLGIIVLCPNKRPALGRILAIDVIVKVPSSSLVAYNTIYMIV